MSGAAYRSQASDAVALRNRLRGARPGERRLELTDREIEVLLLLAAGLTLGECGQVLGRSLEAMKHRAASARVKLGAKTNAQAVAIAWRAGAIS